MNNKKQYGFNKFLLFTAISVGFATSSFSGELLTLEKALDVAMSNSPEIRKTKLDLEQSQESLNAQNAALKSRFSLTLNPFSYSRDRTFDDLFSLWNTSEKKSSSGTFTISQPLKWTDGTLALRNRLSWQDSYTEYNDLSNKTFDNSMSVTYTQPLFTYNSTKLELHELELDMQNSMYSYAIQKLSLEQNVTQQFFVVYQAKMDLDIAIEEHNNQKQSYEIIKNKVDAGLAAMEELYQSELNLANSELQVQNKEEALENALDTFKYNLGISIYDDIAIDSEITHKQVDVDLDYALNTGLKSRLELRQSEINIEYALNNLTRTAADNEFKGNLTLSYGIIGTDEDIENVLESSTKQQTVGVSFNIPLWDWGEKKSRIKASEARIQKQRLSLEDERNTIILAIRKSYRTLKKLINQIEIAEKKCSQRTVDI